MTGKREKDREPAGRFGPGDEQALADLFADQRERLWRMVNFRLDRRLHGRIDPDDVLQEGYLAAVRRLDHYEAGSFESPFLWLRLIMNQTLIDLHRHHLGAQIRDADREVAIHGCFYPQTTSASLANHLVGHLTSPSRAAVRAEAVSRVEEAIGEMSAIDQEVLALRHFEELTNSEVAAILEIEPKAASIRYIRAIRRLKAILVEIPGFSREDENE